jgi:hypothetical protein
VDITKTAGKETEMTAEEEELLAEGKNFEHSSGSVTTGRIEIVLRSHYLIDRAYTYFETNEGKQGSVCTLTAN